MEKEIIGTLNGLTNFSDINKTFINDKVKEKTDQQLKYILSSIQESAFLEACAGSGKTEVVGMKTAYEISKWQKRTGGIAVLTFTNEATETIKARVEQYSNMTSLYPHYIGTLTGFIHGYITQKFGSKFIKSNNKQDTEKSYLLVDKDINVNTNYWMNKYELPVQYIINNKKKVKIYAHQIYYDYKISDYIIHLPLFEDKKLSLESYYNSPQFQSFVNELREKKQMPWLLQLDYIKQQVKNVKSNFYRDGFANFEDINNIAYSILKNNSNLASKLATRFPVILIDECQDLSWIEINILNILRDSGSVLHFIGDLNQSIYGFKNANPEETLNFVSTLKKMQLTDNFRSCHSIVKIANTISSINKPIRGLAEDLLVENSVHYLEYKDINLLKQQYLNFLKSVNISPKNASILVRQQSLKNAFEKRDGESQHLLIDALQLWSTKIPANQILALEFAGKHLQKWFGSAKGTKNYYCPIGITSIFRWRIFLKDFLESFSNYPELLNFNNKTYGEWYQLLKKNTLTLIKDPYKNLENYDTENRDFSELKHRTPTGTAKKAINIITTMDNMEYPSVNTIHSVKGKEYDAVMVVSSQRNSGSGHWKQWIENDSEARRIGYVASTRAKYSLIWAVPTLKQEEKDKLESYGFKPIEI